jgi:hemerythrin superfamily protein
VDALRRMISDHETFEDLRAKLLAAPSPQARGEPAKEFTRRLYAHVTAADDLLVDALRRRPLEPRDLDYLAEFEAVDSQLLQDLERLTQLPPTEAEFDDQLRRVIKELTRHVELEDTRVLPRLEDLLSDEELVNLGAAIERRQSALLRAPNLLAWLPFPGPRSMPFDPVKLARTVGIILAAGILLAVWGRWGRGPRMRTSGPNPPRR